VRFRPPSLILFSLDLMRPFIVAIVLLSSAARGFTADDVSKYALWITGDVFTKKEILLFRADKPVQGNTTADVVLIGPTKDLVNTMGPLLMRAAERHVKVRLYGVLQAASASFPGHHEKLPSVQFIVWKLHLPSDPDDLPPGEKIILGPKDKVEGYKVQLKKP
jgi:hypothetical protein